MPVSKKGKLNLSIIMVIKEYIVVRKVKDSSA